MNNGMTFKRPKNVRIVDMCKWVDANLVYIKENGKYPEIENQIIKYLYFIVDSIAKKQNLFPRFEDYDEFAWYSASTLYLNFRNKLQKEGQIVRGKVVTPIKSCLNFINTVLRAYRVQFQQANYDAVINPFKLEQPEKLQEEMRENVRQNYRISFENNLFEVIEALPNLTYEMLMKTSPYRNDKLMIKRIYLSLLLSFIDNITLPNKIRNRLDSKKNSGNINSKLATIYQQNNSNVILWHLPQHMEGYIRILLVRMKRIVTDELNYKRYSTELSDEVVDSIIKTAFSTYDKDQEDN